MAMCMKCGNELLDYEECAVCAAGRGGTKLAPIGVGDPRQPQVGRRPCPYCENQMKQEKWDGIGVLSCPECRGTFFPGESLEEVLNNLRASVETLEVSAVPDDFKKRFARKLPPSVRYRNCPVCATRMSRQNYGTDSNVIMHVCGTHGTFINEMEFAGLADYIVSSGEPLPDHVRKIHVQLTHDREHAGRTVLDYLFGSRG